MKGGSSKVSKCSLIDSDLSKSGTPFNLAKDCERFRGISGGRGIMQQRDLTYRGNILEETRTFFAAVLFWSNPLPFPPFSCPRTFFTFL